MELSRLRAENLRLKRENEILKKRRRVCYESCSIDEGGPLEAVFQEKASNHFKLLRLRGAVVSVEEKAQQCVRYGMTRRAQANRR